MTFDVRAAALAARQAARHLASAPTIAKNAALLHLADALESNVDSIERTNAQDMEHGRERGLSAAMLDRLVLTPSRIRAMAAGVREVAALPDPVGQVTRVEQRPQGIEVSRVRLPLGVIAIVYESRPNVTIDAAALTLKSGNAVLLKGGSEAVHSNRALVDLCRRSLEFAGLPADSVVFIDSTERSVVLELVNLPGLVDLAIPRGGEGLIRFITENARIPVIQHYKGVCHLFVDRDANLHKALPIVLNAKMQRTGVCNALETLLVDVAVAPVLLPKLADSLAELGCEVRADERAMPLMAGSIAAQPEDWGTEFLAPILAVRVVDNYEDALDHIAKYGSEHTDGIITESLSRARDFVRRVTSSCVVVNASTRFNDGSQLGLGAEIGISTSRLHAFGPMGLEELTSQKFVVVGDGQVRGDA